MSVYTRSLVGALALVCGIAGASPTHYEYSYTFSDGTVVSGTLAGEDNGGGFLTDVADISMFVNGVQLVGSFFAYGYANTWVGWQTWAAKVAFDGSSNGFLFADEAPPLGAPSQYFYYQNSAEWCGVSSCALVSVDPPHFGTSDLGANEASWRLAPLAVPEPATLGLVGIAGLAAFRRSRRSAA